MKDQRTRGRGPGQKERAGLRFETFPHLALVQTFCADHLVADSACSSTAYMCGVKANKDTLGVRAGVKYEDCQAGLEERQQVDSLMVWAQAAGKLTGIGEPHCQYTWHLAMSRRISILNETWKYNRILFLGNLSRI